MICSGSQTDLYFENIPFISDEDLEFAFDMPSSTANGSKSLSWSGKAAAPEATQAKPKSAAARLLHGRSPLGLTKPIVADDLKIAVARPGRILQLICQERSVAQPLTQIVPRGASMPAADCWKTLKAEPPIELPTPAVGLRSRSNSQRRKRNTEPPLARSLTEKFAMKLARRRVVELAVGRGIARRFNDRRSQFM